MANSQMKVWKQTPSGYESVDGVPWEEVEENRVEIQESKRERVFGKPFKFWIFDR